MDWIYTKGTHSSAEQVHGEHRRLCNRALLQERMLLFSMGDGWSGN